MTESSREAVHRALREQLGTYSLGQLGDVESAAIGAHLDGCADCRAELAEIAPLMADLRLVDPSRVQDHATPPAELGSRILQLVAAESDLRDRRDRRARRGRLVGVAAATAGLLAAGVLGGAQLAPERERVRVVVQPAPPGPFEPITVTATGVTVTKAGVVPHTWGLEIKFEGTGFVPGGRYRAVVRSMDGRDLPAGEFIGTGEKSLKCNMQSALLRGAASGFSILDADGRPVVQSRFETI